MAKEIERKYLVCDDSFKDLAHESLHIVQGYLSADPSATVRVRILDDRRAVLTVKGRPAELHFARDEWEYEIPVDDAIQMLGCCGDRVIDKTRYLVRDPQDGMLWEVDVFHGRHDGLVLAEIELDDEAQTFHLPSFVGQDVTDDSRYYNSALASEASY